QSINFNRNFASEDTILPFDGKIAGPRAPPHKGIKSLTTQELFETQTVTLRAHRRPLLVNRLLSGPVKNDLSPRASFSDASPAQAIRASLLRSVAHGH